MKFLTYFQRYLFCKPGLPPDTEFAVLDLLDELEVQCRIAAQREESKSSLSTADSVKKGGRRKHKGYGAAAANGQESSQSGVLLLPIYSTWMEAHSSVEEIERKQHEEKEARKRRYAVMGKDESENAAVEEIEPQESGDDSGDEVSEQLF